MPDYRKEWMEKSSINYFSPLYIALVGLQCWKYPPDEAVQLVELVLQQTEVLSDHWSK